jgi:glycosyltransferase involved in cell wall biosynthesis
MPALKILFVDQSAELGGAELALFGLIRVLPCTGDVLLFEDGPLRGRLGGVGVRVEVLRGVAGPIRVRRDGGAGAALCAVPSVLGLVLGVARRARAYDVIYANSQKAFIVSAVAARLTGRKLVWHLHDILTAEHFGPLARRAAVLAAKFSGCAVIANSRATADALVALGGKMPVTVIYQGIDEAPFAAVTAAQIAGLRGGLGGERAVYVGLFSRLAPWKGQKLFLEAIALVPGVVGVIVGEGLFGEGDYAREVAAHVERLGLQERVRMLGFRDDVPALMRAMDVVVHASTAPEPFGRVVVEGMLAGRPVVASASGGVLEILEDGRTGFLFAPGDAGGLAAVLRGILASPDRGEGVAWAGRDHARRHFAIDAANARVLALINGFSSETTN